jgi:hypothetical protein
LNTPVSYQSQIQKIGCGYGRGLYLGQLDASTRDRVRRLWFSGEARKAAHQNNSIMTLARLQFQGVTENQILNACKLIEVNSHNLNPNSNNSHFG